MSVGHLIEVLLLGCFLYYADIVSDTFILVRFFKSGLYWFFGLNLAGILINTGGQIINLRDRSPRSILLICSQLGMLFECVNDVAGKELLLSIGNDIMLLKMLELVESSISTGIQSYDLVWDAHLTSESQRTLCISLGVSVLALANGLTAWDKESHTATSGGKITTPLSFQFALVLTVRMIEIVSRFGTLCLFQLVCRPYGIFIVVLSNYVFWVIRLYFFGDGNAYTMLFTAVSPFLNIDTYTCPTYFSNGLTPSSKELFNHRILETFAMAAACVITAGSPASVVETWAQYNEATVIVACITGACFALYVLLAPVALWDVEYEKPTWKFTRGQAWNELARQMPCFRQNSHQSADTSYKEVVPDVDVEVQEGEGFGMKTPRG